MNHLILQKGIKPDFIAPNETGIWPKYYSYFGVKQRIFNGHGIFVATVHFFYFLPQSLYHVTDSSFPVLLSYCAYDFTIA